MFFPFNETQSALINIKACHFQASTTYAKDMHDLDKIGSVETTPT
jgi:hypothetical protein